MSHLGEFELIGRIAAQFKDTACHRGGPGCSDIEDSAGPGIVGAGRGDVGAGCDVGPSGVVGIGDDCAVLPQREGVDTLVTTDLLIEGRHFLLSDVSPYELGWKSAAVNISDIAAMGGKPVASFLSIALPKELPPVASGRQEGLRAPATKTLRDRSHFQSRPEAPMSAGASGDSVSRWVDRFIAGFRELSSRFGVPLLGGDTSASPSELFINVTVLGECPHGRAVLRSGAVAGDLICVTGPLGDSAAGLKLILERADSGDTPAPSEALIRRHYLPMPRVAEGMALRECPGVHAMMDISDGIASDLRHILKASASRLSSNNGCSEDGLSKNGCLSSDPARSVPETAVFPSFGHRSATFVPETVVPPSSGRESATLVTKQAVFVTKQSENDTSVTNQADFVTKQSEKPTSVTNRGIFVTEPHVLGAEIDLAAVPMSPELREVCAERGWDAAELAVSGGEDYELLVTLAPEALDAAREALGGRLFVIGRIVEGGGIRWIGGSKDYKGFTHF
jgi:thiamine monophosphate kinase